KGNCRTIQQQSGQSMEGGLYHISHERFETNLSSDLYHSHSITPPSETTEPCKMMQLNIEEDRKALTSCKACDKPPPQFPFSISIRAANQGLQLLLRSIATESVH
ncbi:hypothetical protein HN51_043072, partial [Arachis hypogaea]